MGDILKLDHRQVDSTPEILAVEHLAQLIHKSPSSIRSDASRNPSALPPICRLPGNKRLLWRRDDVFSWISRFVELVPHTARADAVAVNAVPKKRGRPRKTELRSNA